MPATWRTLTNIGTVELMTIAPQRGGFSENANVVVTPSASGLPTGARSELIAELGRAGIQVTSLAVGTTAGRAIVLRCSSTLIGRKLRWLACWNGGAGRTRSPSQPPGARTRSTPPLFATMARSFRLR